MEILDAVSKEELITLWIKGFDEERKDAEDFFDICFSKDRFCEIQEGGHIVSALYWLDYMLDGKKLAYIYAVTTKKDYRNKGYCKKLFDITHEKLKSKGYAGAMLVPTDSSLEFMYEKFGYIKTIESILDSANFPPSEDNPVVKSIVEGSCDSIKIDYKEYARLRLVLLPENSPIPEEYVYKYLDTYADFYKVNNDIYAITRKPYNICIEHLGSYDKSNCLMLLDGMYYPLMDGCPVPKYLGIDLA